MVYRERSEEKRKVFMRRLKRISAKNLVYADETGIEHCLVRKRARAPRGHRVTGKISGTKFKRTNIVSGLLLGKRAAPFQYSGSTDSALFEHWFENCLLKEIGRNKYIVMDNASFHRKSVLAALAESKKCRVIFLPPYSPDLNPIENKWAWLKHKLTDILPAFRSLDDAIWSAFQVD